MPVDVAEITQLVREYLSYFNENYNEDRPGAVFMYACETYLGWGIGMGSSYGRTCLYMSLLTAKDTCPDVITTLSPLGTTHHYLRKSSRPGFKVQIAL
jgi:hypothetical protein